MLVFTRDEIEVSLAPLTLGDVPTALPPPTPLYSRDIGKSCQPVTDLILSYTTTLILIHIPTAGRHANHTRIDIVCNLHYAVVNVHCAHSVIATGQAGGSCQTACWIVSDRVSYHARPRVGSCPLPMSAPWRRTRSGPDTPIAACIIHLQRGEREPPGAATGPAGVCCGPATRPCIWLLVHHVCVGGLGRFQSGLLAAGSCGPARDRNVQAGLPTDPVLSTRWSRDAAAAAHLALWRARAGPTPSHWHIRPQQPMSM